MCSLHRQARSNVASGLALPSRTLRRLPCLSGVRAWYGLPVPVTQRSVCRFLSRSLTHLLHSECVRRSNELIGCRLICRLVSTRRPRLQVPILHFSCRPPKKLNPPPAFERLCSAYSFISFEIWHRGCVSRLPHLSKQCSRISGHVVCFSVIMGYQKGPWYVGE